MSTPRKKFPPPHKKFAPPHKKNQKFSQLKISRCDNLWFYGNFCDFKWFFVQPIYTKGFDVSIFLDMSFVFFIISKSKKMAKSLILSSLQRFIYDFKVCPVWFFENLCDPVRIFENLWDFLIICVIGFLHFLEFLLRFFFESYRTVRPTWEKVFSEK